ncbi:trichohyalin-like [Xiphias gladius]|uniref:trichohyalin-like n=1 Tax=Xiphias gladius TaxID=8245 RepID=UPI001A995A1C|nr:trichohyalin-like isoform X1 [Xiphias gladius]XP_039979244.1 trichohyalin-like [Xiphias gladius]
MEFRQSSYGPLTAQLQHTVQGLRDTLYSAISDIKSLKEENKALKEQLDLVENGRREKESQLREELRQKDELLKRLTKKRQARTKAHVDCLVLLNQKDRELQKIEEEWKTRYEALEASLQQELARREESWSRKVQEEENEKNLHYTQQLSSNTVEQEENKIHGGKEEKEIKNKQEENRIHKEENMKNKENERVEEEAKRSEDKQMNEKIEKRSRKKRGKKKKNRG